MDLLSDAMGLQGVQIGAVGDGGGSGGGIGDGREGGIGMRKSGAEKPRRGDGCVVGGTVMRWVRG